MKHWHLFVTALFFTHVASAQQTAPQSTKPISTLTPEVSPALNFDIKSTSITELMNMKITSLTGKSENLSKAPAAIYVITGDEIKRMGVTQLAETLRYVPGLEIARVGANQWSISIRGFNGSNANKLLVLIDGRSIYSTLYSGVLWQQQDVLLDDIDRIEITRGPGGVLWGTNAVNGVINIITKNSKDTQGVYVSGGGGTINELAQARVGTKLGENLYGRVYAKATHEKASPNIPIDDSARMLQSGFRIDRYSTSIGDMTLQGDIYRGGIGPDLLGFTRQIPGFGYNGNNLLFHWIYDANADRNHQFIAYIDNTGINASGQITDHRDTLYANYQITQRLQPQEFIWGIGSRRVSDHVGVQISSPLPPYTVFPESKIDRTYTSYIQDDISLLKDKAHLIVGTKYEHNDYTGSEWQPNIRTSYAIADNSLLWVSWSRAVRVPSRLEEDLVLPSLFNVNPNLKAESASVYEVGWRKAWERGVSMGITAYTSKYINLVTAETTSYSNKMSGHVSGVEFSPTLQLQPNWLLRFNYSHTVISMGVSDSSIAHATSAVPTENASPRDTSQLASMWDINERWQLNTFLRYVNQIKILASQPTFPFARFTSKVSPYTVMDASVVWKQNKNVSWQLAARDLGKKHFEWGGVNSAQIAPSIALYVRVTA
jgi:iron complex outermembrane receptor protein